jgi:hypothetical protein
MMRLIMIAVTMEVIKAKEKKRSTFDLVIYDVAYVMYGCDDCKHPLE